MNSNVRKEERLLKVGILGCGLISQAAHLIGCTKARNIKLQAICDVSEELREKMAAVYQPESVYADYEQMLADPEIDAVVIGIGDQFHTPCAEQAIRAGKHVLIEKPMGVSVEACEELKKLAEEEKRLVQIGHMKRFDEGLQYAKRFREEKLGEPVVYRGWYCDSIGRYTLTDNVMPVIYSSAQARKPAGNPKSILDHYYLLGHGSHLFDTPLFLMGPIRRVSARFAHQKKLYSWLINCDFENGAIGDLHLSVAIAQAWHEGCEVFGTGGSIYAKTYNPWEMRASEVECFDAQTCTSIKPAAFDGQFYRRELEAFADSILNGEPVKGASAEDGIMVMKALIATYQSVHEGGSWISLEDARGEL